MFFEQSGSVDEHPPVQDLTDWIFFNLPLGSPSEHTKILDWISRGSGWFKGVFSGTHFYSKAAKDSFGFPGPTV